MCEMCTKHGEGRKWYLQIKNYSDELLHTKLSDDQKKAAQANTRIEDYDRFFTGHIMPAMGVSAQSVDKGNKDDSKAQDVQKARPTEQEALEKWEVGNFSQVLPIEDAEGVLDQASSITRMACGCRYKLTGKTDKRYCIGLGIDRMGVFDRYPDAASSLEVLDKAEAKKIVRGFDEDGLIHAVFCSVTPYVCTLCNCDYDCFPYKRFLRKRAISPYYRAEYICAVDWDLCSDCKSCLGRCQFGALFHSSSLGKVHIDPTRCYGCGLCRVVCPNDAISLLPREEHPEAAEIWSNETQE